MKSATAFAAIASFALFVFPAIAASPSAEVQRSAAKPARIGYLSGRALDFEEKWLAAFRRGMRDLGYIEGGNFVIEERHAAGRTDRLPALARELARLKVDVLVAAESFSAIEAKNATNTIPIVSLTQDPVALGLVENMARPGGNVTGMSDYHAGMANKRLELLKEVVPAASRFAVFQNPGIVPNQIQLKDLQAAARSMKSTLVVYDIKDSADVDQAFMTMRQDRVHGLVLLPGGAISSNQKRIADLAIRDRLPSIYTVSIWAELGGLMAYGTDFDAYFRRAATFVDRILKGAKPADLPIEQPTNFQLVVNLRTAKALGISIPASILVRADRVIEQ
jgi:putative ABC transport system substrate-binding protein